jgi:hypothetical protein
MNMQIERAVKIMEMWAEDPAHGYDQQYRWGERGDYDCSSAVISAVEMAGIPVKSKGATYTGNIYPAFIACGFEDVTASIDLVHGVGLHRGDVLLNHRNHTAMYAGGGKTVEASINENGKTTGGTPGDQTGAEFLLRLYRNYPWDCVLRFTGEDYTPTAPEAKAPEVVLVSVRLPQIQKGDKGPAVAMMQAALKYHGYDPQWIDGDFGTRSNNMLMAFQAEHNLEADGICGSATWAALGIPGRCVT